MTDQPEKNKILTDLRKALAEGYEPEPWAVGATDQMKAAVEEGLANVGCPLPWNEDSLARALATLMAYDTLKMHWFDGDDDSAMKFMWVFFGTTPAPEERS